MHLSVDNSYRFPIPELKTSTLILPILFFSSNFMTIIYLFCSMFLKYAMLFPIIHVYFIRLLYPYPLHFSHILLLTNPIILLFSQSYLLIFFYGLFYYQYYLFGCLFIILHFYSYLNCFYFGYYFLALDYLLQVCC